VGDRLPGVNAPALADWMAYYNTASRLCQENAKKPVKLPCAVTDSVKFRHIQPFSGQECSCVWRPAFGPKK